MIASRLREFGWALRGSHPHSEASFGGRVSALISIGNPKSHLRNSSWLRKAAR
jgi:hypothetical protein